MTITDTPDLNAKMMEALGRSVVTWSLLESFVCQLFIVATNGDRAAMYVVTENVSISTLITWIRTLIATKPEEAIDAEILEILDEVDQLRADRNLYMHGMWQPQSDGAMRVQSLNLARSTIFVDTVVTLTDLQEFVIETSAVGEKLFGILKNFGILNAPGD